METSNGGPRNATGTFPILGTHTSQNAKRSNTRVDTWAREFPHTFSVMPSSTYSASVSNQVPVTVSLSSPVSGSTAYKGALPARCSQICFNVTQPPRVLPSADSRYSRLDVDEYRIDTVVLASHSGLGMGSFGDSVSVATASWRASMLRIVAFPSTFGMVMMRCFEVKIWANRYEVRRVGVIVRFVQL